MPTPAISTTWRVKRLNDLLPKIRMGLVRLFTNVWTPGESDQWYNYTEPSGGWYAPRPLTDLTAAAWAPSEGAQAHGGPYAWALGISDPPVTIRGAWLSDEQGRYLSAVQATSPITLSPGGAAISVSVVFTL